MLTRLIAFLTFLLFASASLKAVYRSERDLDCPDQEVHDQCLTECRVVYLDCRANCESSLCNSECLGSFQQCDASCPCGMDCPCGCQDCPEHPLCEQTPTDPSDVSILVILNDLSASYLTSGDGSSKFAAKLSAPRNDYTNTAKHALVNGEVHIFGGTTDYRKIAKLTSCSFVELSARLSVGRDAHSEALSIESGSQALICFNAAESRTCEIFDGTKTTTTFSTSITHELGGLGFYKSKPTTVGCRNIRHKKAETLTSNGWSAIPDHPEALAAHSSVGLDDGSMVLLGGAIGKNYQTGIWQIKEDVWFKIGQLTQSSAYGSALYNGRSIYYFSGYGPSSFPNHRVDLTANKEIKEVVRIGNHPKQYNYPVLFLTTSDYCV